MGKLKAVLAAAILGLLCFTGVSKRAGRGRRHRNEEESFAVYSSSESRDRSGRRYRSRSRSCHRHRSWSRNRVRPATYEEEVYLQNQKLGKLTVFGRQTRSSPGHCQRAVAQ